MVIHVCGIIYRNDRLGSFMGQTIFMNMESKVGENEKWSKLLFFFSFYFFYNAVIRRL